MLKKGSESTSVYVKRRMGRVTAAGEIPGVARGASKGSKCWQTVTKQAMKRSLILVICASLVASTSASAQRASELQEGVRVRVTRSHGRSVVGTYLGAEMDSVRVLQEGHERPQRLPAGDVSKIEVSRGRSRAKGALIKGLIGLGIGAVSGAIVGAATYSDSDSTVCNADFGCGPAFCILICSKSQAAGLVGTIGAAAGLVIGTITGVVTGQEQWQTATLREDSVSATLVTH
jgi:hypothetical protein